MDEALKKYLQSIEESVKLYEEGKLETKEYLKSMEETKEWLEERCNENSRD